MKDLPRSGEGNKELDLLCIGNALVDVFARGKKQVASEYGITRPVQHVEIQKLMEIISAVSNSGVKGAIAFGAGGGAANVAKIAGFLGTNVCFTGAVGTENQGKADGFGRLFESELASAGVKLKLPGKPSPTGICLIFRAEDGETLIAAAPSAAHEFGEGDLCEGDIQRAKVVLIDGYMMDRPGLVRRILNLADKYGTTAALDLSSAAIAGEQAGEIAEYIRQYSFILFMNEEEAEVFYSALKSKDPDFPLDEENNNKQWISSLIAERRRAASLLREACSFFQSLTDRNIFPLIVVKLGKRGAISFAGGNIYRTRTLEVIPLDTTGAGDTFCAAFLSAWVRNKSLAECAKLGNRAARIALGFEGTLIDRKHFKNIAQMLR